MSGLAKIINHILIAMFSILQFACRDEDFFTQEGFKLEASNNFMLSDGKSEIILRIKNKNNGIVNTNLNDIRFYSNDVILSSNKFSSNQSGEYSIIAKRGNSISNTIKITARQRKEYRPVELQLIFHIVTDKDVVGGIDDFSAATIENYLQGFNTKFNNTEVNPEATNPNKVRPEIYFRLAETDPSGEKLIEPGIDRIRYPDKSSTIYFERWMLNSFWDPERYINIWIGRTGDNNSRSRYPVFPNEIKPLPGLHNTAASKPPGVEGIILLSSTVRRNLTETLAHEMGHYLGLFHVFADTCQMEDADFCPDTNFLNSSRMTCDGSLYFPDDNFMDYYGTKRTFTFDQVERMRYSVENAKWRAQSTMIVR